MSRNLKKGVFSLQPSCHEEELLNTRTVNGWTGGNEVFFSRQTCNLRPTQRSSAFPLNLNTNSAMTVEHNKFEAFECRHL